MKDALLFIVSSIVNDSSKVSIDENMEEGITNFIIHAAKEDIGKIIGKEGKIIRAIRNVMKIPAIKQNKRVHITVAED
jgi:predicted RNA-binding protein YlqC (UPF0109 family)